MKRRLEILPTFLLLLVFIYSLFQRLSGNSWVNLFVIGLAGLCIYTPVIIFVDGITRAFRYRKPLPKGDKLFFTYMISLTIVFIFLAIYLMAHN